MSDALKKNTKLGIMIESVEGTYVAPSSASKYLAPLEAVDFGPEIEKLERAVLHGNLGKIKSLNGMRSANSTIKVELKSSGTPGQEPQSGPLFQSAVGGKRIVASQSTTKATGNTSTSLKVEDADVSKYNIGDIILIKQAGLYHVSPIISINSTPGSCALGLLVENPSLTPANSTVIEKTITYFTANSGHPSLSLSKYIEDERIEKIFGVKVKTMEFGNFVTGQIADVSFGLQAMDFSQELGSVPHTPSFDASIPGVVLSAKFYVDGVEVPANELGLSLENTLVAKTAFNEENGKIKQVVTDRSVNGNSNPYKSLTDLDWYEKFRNATNFSVFAYVAVPNGVNGEFKDVVAIYKPKVSLSSYTEGDDNGLLRDILEWSSDRGDGSTEELYIGMI